MGREIVDHDQIFKTLIKEFFREFMELFLPREAAEIDFARIEFLDKETFTDTPRGEKRAMDLVAKVGLKRGGDECILVHNEFESSRPTDGEFQARMFRYFCQLHLRHGLPVIPVALFTDDHKWTRPMEPVYEVRFLNRAYNRFEFHLVKLKQLRWQDYLRSNNVLAFALMAKMDYDPRQKVRLKADFLRMILRAKVNPARENMLVEFIDSYCPLKAEEQEAFEELTRAVKHYEEVAIVMTSFEKRGLEKGLERGKLEGKLEGQVEALQGTLIRILEKRFHRVSSAEKKVIRGVAQVHVLEHVVDLALDAGSVKDVIAAIKTFRLVP